MYLNITSLYDLLLFDKAEVHPSYIYGQKPLLEFQNYNGQTFHVHLKVIG